MSVHLQAQDILVKKDGTILKVYNLEESSNSYFYTLEPSSDAALTKISKEDVFSVKRSDGSELPQTPQKATTTDKAKPTREAVTAIKTMNIGGKGRGFKATTPDGHELNYRIISDEDHTVAVVKGKYKEKEYVIPEYVKDGNTIYTVTEIGEDCFSNRSNVCNVQFPNTLKK